MGNDQSRGIQNMDFQTVVDSMPAMACVVSVEKLPGGKRGKFRIVTGNRAYIDSIENPAPGTKMLKDKFVPGSEYTDYLTRDLNFEDYCYRAAVEKKCLHSYAHPERMDVWFNMMFIPLTEERDDLSFCIYLMEINFEADSENLSNNISSDVAASVLDTCIRLRGTNDFRATMKDVVTGIRELCDAEFCCIMIMNDFDRSCEVLAEALSENTRLLSMETYVNDEFYDIAESWSSTIAGSNCLIAKNEQDMEIVRERNPVWHESLTLAGAHNIVLFPLKSRNQLLGYMWVINFDQERSVKIKETLEVTTFIVGSELGNYLLLDRLRLLSSMDLLTGVLNRNEMNNYVDSLCQEDEKDIDSVGVIFADLNGLKAINDIEGHNAGDLLLKNAASALKEVFDENNIYRAGGDEFSVILKGITKEELDDKITALRKASLKYGNVVFALGGSVEKDSRNVRMALRQADENMYEDKRRFYEQNPERMDEFILGDAVDEGVDEKFRERSIFREINYDHLTGLPSMTYFLKLAEIGRKSMHERDIPSVLVFINLNGLKYYNKKYGFAEGDVLIKEIANVLAKIFGEENSSRFGQDYFAVFTEADGLEKKLGRLFKEAKTVNGGRSLPLRVGIYPDSMGLVETSLACDRAKYASNVYRDEHSSYFNYYDNRMLSAEINRQYIADNIDRAISENWIKAFYQPIVRATNRMVCDEEALARWIDPKKGMLSPADFIPILEDTRLIYKVDLHIVDIILERIKNQKKAGRSVVPVSVNLSRTDFETCDIVTEINNRVEAAGVSKDLITIEITESVIGKNFDFMKEQIGRFQKLGFSVWMDDFGSGYSSLDLLQEMKFDLIKFDMRFMRQFDTSPRSRIILTELMRMAQNLGIETVCEGVETAEQAEFLSEIGCTKMQGYYFCKPIPLEEIWERYSKGIQIGFENPDEAEYHKVVGAINMYDLSSVSNEETETSKRYFETLPMAVVEFNGETVKVIRCNKTYREFILRFFKVRSLGNPDSAEDIRNGTGAVFIDAITRCMEEGHRVFLDEKMSDGSTVHAMINKAIDNPVSGVTAFTVAVLGITPESEQQLSYANVAQALSSDYLTLYYVNIETGHFVEYSNDGSSKGLSVERHGDDFFNESHRDIETSIYEADRDTMLSIFTRENILRTIDDNGAFVHTYRLMINGEPTFVNMKIVRMGSDDRHIIIGVNNVDAQMKQQETIERLKEEQITYSRISALMGDFIAIYTVDPETGHYMQYSASREFLALGTSKAGTDFFKDSYKDIRTAIYPDDLEHFMSEFSKERILERIKDSGVYKINYRLMINNEPVMISLRAGMVQEKDGPQLIVGVGRSHGI
ncbi:MAG: EAL domain-containing protein [Lachnospiraceae bacterium]|nr:EAL domain-containing protein [Lachnospiraceae bacterium]